MIQIFGLTIALFAFFCSGLCFNRYVETVEKLSLLRILLGTVIYTGGIFVGEITLESLIRLPGLGNDVAASMVVFPVFGILPSLLAMAVNRPIPFSN